MKISELIEKIGDENIDVQFLHQCCLSSQDLKKGNTKVSFLTDVPTAEQLNPKGSTALILWVKKKDLESITKN